MACLACRFQLVRQIREITGVLFLLYSNRKRTDHYLLFLLSNNHLESLFGRLLLIKVFRHFPPKVSGLFQPLKCSISEVLVYLIVGNSLKAALILDTLEKQCPNILVAMLRRINTVRRRGEFDQVCSLYEQYIEQTSDKREISSSLAIKYARFCSRVTYNFDSSG